MTPPDVLLAAARKALPFYQWFLCGGKVVRVNGMRRLKHIHFDIERYWPDLQIALEKEGWVFYQLDDLFGASKGAFSAFFDEVQLSNTVHAATKPDLLLAIVREGV